MIHLQTGASKKQETLGISPASRQQHKDNHTSKCTKLKWPTVLCDLTKKQQNSTT